jgi:hypothetical protein
MTCVMQCGSCLRGKFSSCVRRRVSKHNTNLYVAACGSVTPTFTVQCFVALHVAAYKIYVEQQKPDSPYLILLKTCVWKCVFGVSFFWGEKGGGLGDCGREGVSINSSLSILSLCDLLNKGIISFSRIILHLYLQVSKNFVISFIDVIRIRFLL